MRHLARTLSVCLSLAILGSAAVALADDGSIKLISRGPRRDALTAMTYKPFDGELWGKLDGWMNGSPVTKETTKGKPVLIVAWASWYLTSHNALAEAQKIADKYPDFVVVGVHHQTVYDKAPEVVAAKGVKFPIAHDVKKEFFPALKIEAAGPNFYIIDRAGNLRFPDVDKGSLDAAAKIVSDEKPEDAAKAESRAKEAAKENGSTPMGGPDVKTKVSAEDYKKVKWPAVNAGGLSAKNMQGKPLPAKFGKEKWLGAEPNRDGKIVVIDFWATWCGPCKMAMPHLDDLYKKYEKDVVVIGISDEKETDVKNFIKQAKHSYPQAIDQKATIKSALGVQGIPHVVVLSTDGVIRWQGNPHPQADQAGLDDTIAKLIEVDPGVKARRASEKKS
jgi:thiol-disulfide isomerase/thioredoxin